MELTITLHLDLFEADAIAKLVSTLSYLPCELTLTLTFSITGSFHPGNWDNPPEYPDFDILEVSSASLDFDEEGLDPIDVPIELCWGVYSLLGGSNQDFIEELAYEVAEESNAI